MIGKKHPDKVRLEALDLRKKGMTLARIAKRLGVDPSTISRWQQAAETTGEARKRFQNTGRPRKRQAAPSKGQAPVVRPAAPAPLPPAAEERCHAIEQDPDEPADWSDVVDLVVAVLEDDGDTARSWLAMIGEDAEESRGILALVRMGLEVGLRRLAIYAAAWDEVHDLRSVWPDAPARTLATYARDELHAALRGDPTEGTGR